MKPTVSIKRALISAALGLFATASAAVWTEGGATPRAESLPAAPAPGSPGAAPSGAAPSGPGPQKGSSEAPPASRAGGVTDRAALVAARAVAAAPTPDGQGFWVAWSNGRVTTAGDAQFHGDLSKVALAAPIVGIAATSSGAGYWLLGADGGVFSFGDAGFHGSTGNIRLAAPALQMVSSQDGAGYDFVAGDGGIFSFGDAVFHGSTGGIRLTRSVVGMAATPSGAGYWLVASDGGVFSFGDAGFHGSTGGLRLGAPVVGVAPTADGQGYWLLASDGGVFTFGDASFHGSGVGRTGGSPAVGIVATHDGQGYWIVLASGAVLANGDATPVAASAVVTGPSAPPGSYTFEAVNAAGQPARWNPCEVVSYAVVAAGAPAGWQNDVANAIGQVSAATGISFAETGVYAAASQVPSSVGITISWVPQLTGGDEVGLTTYWYYTVAPYTPQIVTADVQLLTSLHGGTGTGAEQPVLLHELGHAMGLGHTSAVEVMNPVDLGLSSYQSGDLAGLWHVGSSQGCAGFFK